MHEVTLVPCQDLFPLALRLMFRAYRGDLSQDAMGGKMRAFHTYISNIERGETIPGIGSFERFAKAFGVPAWRLMSEIECLASLLGQAEV
jgi:transcriptional regulator with XRE-family HTH domain